MDNSLNYQQVWQKPQYIATKVKTFEMLDKYLNQSPKCILDIGCGFAKVSELFQKKYGSDLYLLESDMKDSPGRRIGKWGTVESFQWYLPLDVLKQAWDSQGLQYNFLDGSNINLSKTVKFDLVYSWLSCGFHYPVTTYRDFIKQHTTPDSVIIMDFRNNISDKQQKDFDNEAYEILDCLEVTPKKRTLRIRFR
jgi:SAM-dependent methyltransferase